MTSQGSGDRELLRRQEIDASFALMALDAEFHERALRIAEEFSTSDWEALQLAEDLGGRGRPPADGTD